MEIAGRISPGRAVQSYALLDEIQERHGLTRQDAHEHIHAILDQLILDDGEEAIVVSRRPMRPELLEDNPGQVDVSWWLTISAATADLIREMIGAGLSGRA